MAELRRGRRTAVISLFESDAGIQARVYLGKNPSDDFVTEPFGTIDALLYVVARLIADEREAET